MFCANINQKKRKSQLNQMEYLIKLYGGMINEFELIMYNPSRDNTSFKF